MVEYWVGVLVGFVVIIIIIIIYEGSIGCGNLGILISADKINALLLNWG